MQRIAYIIISTVLVVCCSIYALGQKKVLIQNYTASEEIVDTNSSSQNTRQEEAVVNKPETVSSDTTTSSEISEKPTKVPEKPTKVSSEKSVETSKESTTQKYATPRSSGKFKSYTNYKLLNRNSSQWTKIQCNKNAYTDKNGLRKVGEYYCVAMGSYYSRTLGDLFEIQTEGGSFKVIICDFKADAHTDINHQYSVSNGCMVEFYVDIASLNDVAKRMGNISYIDKNFKGKIIAVNKLGNYFEK